ncbi:MAG: hypothetical protein MJ188_00455 [Treponema sp.]|nr:hypothetical protein [Treponema sp.]
MKKIAIITLSIFVLLNTAFAKDYFYNPSVGGDSFYELSSPRTLSNGASVTGGGLFYAGPEAMNVNPALTASNQRVGLNLANTLLFGSGDGEKFGDALQAGILIPFKWAVLSGYYNGTFCSLDPLNVGNSMTMKAGLSKEITDKLDIGMNLNTGIFWGADTDWLLSANLGFLYVWGNLGPVKDFRFGASLLNLGKNLNHTTLPRIKTDDGATLYDAKLGLPTIATLKAGAAGTFYSNKVIKLAGSFDLTTPMFMNLIADMGLQLSIKDMFYVSVSDKFNVLELAKGYVNVIPSVGITFRFTFDVKNSEYLAKNGWSQSEMSVNSAWKQLYGGINAVSFGADVDLGLKDKTPPVIKLWIDDEELTDETLNESTEGEK